MESSRREGDWVTTRSYENCNSYYVNPPRRMKPYNANAMQDMSSLQNKAATAYSASGCACTKVASNGRRASSARANGGAESKRRKRVAQYKSYAVEARVKISLKNGLLWFKHKYMQVRYGWSF